MSDDGSTQNLTLIVEVGRSSYAAPIFVRFVYMERLETFVGSGQYYDSVMDIIEFGQQHGRSVIEKHYKASLEVVSSKHFRDVDTVKFSVNLPDHSPVTSEFPIMDSHFAKGAALQMLRYVARELLGKQPPRGHE